MIVRAKIFLISLTSLVLAGCGSMPKHYESRVEQSASLVFRSIPENATVMVGESPIERSSEEDEVIVQVPDGTHQVRVTAQGATIYDREVFVNDGARKIINLGAE